MTNDLYDVAAPQFEEQLWHELAATHAAVRNGSHMPSREPRWPRRRTSRRGLVAATGAVVSVAAAITAVVVISGPDGDSTRDPGTHTGTPQEAGVDLADQISQAAQAAAADSIVHIYQDARGEPETNYDSERWYDETTGWARDLYYDLEGQPSYDNGAATAPSLDEPPPPDLPAEALPTDPNLTQRVTRTVDYCFAEYADTSWVAIPGQNYGEEVAERLASGELIEDGTEIVDGRELIRIVETNGSLGLADEGVVDGEVTATETIPANEGDGQVSTSTVPVDEQAAAEAAEAAEELAAAQEAAIAEVDPDEVLSIYLVDPETYRPVMLVGYPGTQPDYSDATYVMTFEYLARTPENMANLVTPVPAGFTEVDQLHGDGERVDNGC